MERPDTSFNLFYLDEAVYDSTLIYKMYLHSSGFANRLNSDLSYIGLWNKVLEIGKPNELPDLNTIYLNQLLNITKDLMIFYGINSPELEVKNNNLYLGGKSILLDSMSEINNNFINYINKENPENPIIMSLHDLSEINVKLNHTLTVNLGQKIKKNLDDNDCKKIEIIMNNKQYYLLNPESGEQIKLNKMDIKELKENNKNIFLIENNIVSLAMNSIQQQIKPNNTLKI